jgi:hypothetical protein
MNSLASPQIEHAMKSDKRNRGELSRVCIEPAENGFTVRCDFDPKDNGKKQMVYPEPETMVFESVTSMLKYLKPQLEAIAVEEDSKE